MKVHGVNFSPFVQRVLIAGRIKGHELEIAPVSGGGMQSPQFAAISPMRRIPVLEEEDGWTLPESGPIIAYLDEALPGPSLLPPEPRRRAKARLIATLVDVEFAAGLRHFVVQKLFAMADEPAQLAYGQRQIDQGLEAIEQVGLDAPWAVGEQPTIADCALIPFLTLSELIAEFRAIRCASLPPGIDAYWHRAKASDLGARSFSVMREGFLAAARARAAA